MEMLKKVLHSQPDWNCRAAFNTIDSQRQEYISHPQIYSFMNSLGYEATDEELIAIVRRIDSSGNGTLEYHEFKIMAEQIILKMTDIQQVEDQGVHINPHKYDGQSNLKNIPIR